LTTVAAKIEIIPLHSAPFLWQSVAQTLRKNVLTDEAWAFQGFAKMVFCTA